MRLLTIIAALFSLSTLTGCGKEVKYEFGPDSSYGLSTLMTNTISYLPAGQYSGITKISDTRYAVVHDKKLEGGFLYFDLTFNQSGIITSSSYEIPAGTKAGRKSRDPEGIVYVPSSGTLFVCGEEDYKILEYDMDGKPTGRGLKIPDYLKTGDVGYESLAYNENTGLFWTTTDKPAEASSQGDLYYLQSFEEKTFEPYSRFSYVTDRALYSPAAGELYSFGISDMLALDDGRLIVMEREAYVPCSKIGAGTKIKLYLVDPKNDRGDVLKKKLLVGITTGLLSWANYEGICFGPILSGKQTILLINDSQDRYGDFLNDYINVLTINPAGF